MCSTAEKISFSQLEEAGIVASDCGKNPESGKDVRAVRYRLRDNYSRFYLKYIEPEKSAIDSGAFSLGSLDRLDGWDSVMGLAFENLVVNNLRELVVPLGFGSALLTSAAPYRRTALIYEGHLALIVEADGYFDAVIPFSRLLRL